MIESEGSFSQPANIEEYKERANPILGQHGQQIVKKSQYNLMKWALIIFGAGLLIFAYLIAQDKFKTEVSCPTFTCPALVPCPECPQCPNNNFSCPTCSNTCNFPTQLNISLKNSS